MDIFTSPQFQEALANAVILIITGIVGALSRAFYLWLKAHTTQQQFSILEQIADAAVNAAEQGAIGGFVTDKKATATAIVNEYLTNAKITGLTAQQIDAAIEAAVKVNFNADLQASAKPVTETPVPDETAPAGTSG